MRPIAIRRRFTRFAEGSVLIQFGDTWVVCTASVDDRVPPFLRGSGQGWVSAEFGMLARATMVRSPRDQAGRASGRSLEIQRLVGRSLRAVMDLRALGERTIWIDCDVLQADGGTRTASITGGFVALADALAFLSGVEGWSRLPLTDFVAAASVGITDEGGLVLDLCYDEDSRARVDMNIVMTGSGGLVEVQGTAEHSVFSRDELERMLGLAQAGIGQLVEHQRSALGEIAGMIGHG